MYRRDGNIVGLRARIFLILLFILLPILGLFYVNTQQEERILAEVALGQAQDLAAHFASDYSDLAADTERLLASLARLPEIGTISPGCNAVLAWYRATYPYYLNLGLIDRHGVVVCSGLPTGQRVYAGDRPYFRQAIETRRFSLGDYQIGRITHEPSVNFGYPVFNAAGDVQAVVYAALNLQRLGRIGVGTVLPGGSIVTLVARDGTVLLRAPDPERWTGRRMPEADVLAAIQSKGQGVVDTQGADGIRRLYGFAPLQGFLGSLLHVSVGIRNTSVIAQHRELVTRSLAGLILLGLAGLGAARLAFGTVLLRPVGALVAATHRVGQGELSARSGISYRAGELGQLARAFDEMAAEIERRAAERDKAEQLIVQQLQTLTALYAGARQLTLSLDLDDLVRRIVRVFVENFGARSALIGRALPDGRVRWLAHYPAEATWLEDVQVRWDEVAQGQGPGGRAIRTGFPVVVSDVVGDVTMAPWRDALLQHGVASLAAFPLISRDKTVGIIDVLSDEATFFAADRVELFAAFANQAAAALENARLHTETTDRLEQVEALSKIDLAIASSVDLKMTLNVLLDYVTARLRVDAADVLLVRPETQALEHAAHRGFRDERITHTRLRVGEEYAGRAALERRTVSIPNLREPQTVPQALGTGPKQFISYLITVEQFVSYAAAPLIAKGRVLGVLEVYHRSPLESDPSWLSFLESLAGQAAIAVDNATLFNDLQRSNLELAHAYDTTLEGWSRAMDLRDKETEGHTQRVTELTVRLARAMGMSEDTVTHVRRGALLHDIGKMGVPDAILLKPGPLTEEEWARMRQHPIYARNLLEPIAHLRPALAIPYSHHEKWDGTGYPDGLRGEQIPLEARIFAIVDVWDALVSDRPYRPGWSKTKALAYIRDQSGKHFDPRVTAQFLKLLEAEGGEPGR